MLFDLLLKIFLTPENVIGLLWSIATTVCMCFIFKAWKEKWWKSLIPVYGTYLIYKNTWKRWKWLFLLELLFHLLTMKCTSFMKKHIVYNIFYTVKTYLETEKIDLDISVEKMMVCMLLLLMNGFVVFILKRVTYVKICTSLSIHNAFIKIGAFLFPQIFLFVVYIIFARRQTVLTQNGMEKMNP